MIDLSKFEELKTTTDSQRAVSMIAAKKFKLSFELLKHLGITEKDYLEKGKSKTLRFLFKDSEKKMIIMQGPGAILSGSINSPEVYFTKACERILKIINKRLLGAGTVSFPEVKLDKNEDTPILVVDLNTFVSNPGVLADIVVEGGNQ